MTDRGTVWRRLLPALMLAVLVGVAACSAPKSSGGTAARSAGGGAATPGTTPTPGGTPAPIASSGPEDDAAQCRQPLAGVTALAVDTSDGESLGAAEMGAGQRGVVLVPESGNTGLCGWWAYAKYLASHGFHVLLFDQRCVGYSTCRSGGLSDAGLSTDVAAAVQRLRVDGATRIALVGASLGAAEVVIVGSVPAADVVGVVALSADTLDGEIGVPPYPATAREAATKLTLPVLVAVARDDRYVSVEDETALYQSMPSKHKQLLVEPAAAGHGWSMLSAAPNAWSPLALTIATFLSTTLAIS